MGQGTNSYTNVQLSRYVSALANRGNVYELSLVDKVMTSDGRVVVSIRRSFPVRSRWQTVPGMQYRLA